MKLNQAVSARLTALLREHGMTQYQLYMKSGVPKSTIGNVINCSYDSVKLRIIHELCQGMEIGMDDFFASPLSKKTILEAFALKKREASLAPRFLLITVLSVNLVPVSHTEAAANRPGARSQLGQTKGLTRKAINQKMIPFITDR